MIFWILAALLTVGGIVVLLRPLLNPDATLEAPNNANIEIYRDQLGEIERDMERGQLNEEEAEAAKIEVSRRLLAAGELAGSYPEIATATRTTTNHQRIAAGVGTSVVAFSLIGYLALGTPGLPSQPHAERRQADPGKLPIGELIAQVEQRLKENPNDARGWDVIAPIYLKQGNFAKAARAYERSIKLNGESDLRLAKFAEAALGVTNGQVTPPVKTAYERLLVLQPDFLPAHFWLAMHKEQNGDKKAAALAYRKILGRPNLAAQLRRLIVERLRAVGDSAPLPEVQTSGAAPKSANAGARTSDAGQGQMPSREARQEMARLTPQQRQQRIRSMVEGLADRLRSDGGDLAEWQRLIRAYTVLGEKKEAALAFAEARKAFAAKVADLKQLEQFAQSLGLSTESGTQ